MGYFALGKSTGSANTAIGRRSKQTPTFVAGINGATLPDGVAVIVDRPSHLGTVSSSKHVKDAIKPMDKASEAILALKPATFRYKHELDPPLASDNLASWLRTWRR